MGARILINGAKTGIPWSLDYYLRNEHHIVTSDLSLKRYQVVDFFPFHFKHLVEAMSNCSPGDDVGIVCHGIPRKLGVTPSISASFWAEINFARRMARLDPDLSAEMGLSDQQWEIMTDQIMHIRHKLRLNHIMIQACRIGQSKDFLYHFGRIFLAKSISAPTLKTIYGNCEVYQASTKADRDKFRVDFPHQFNVPVSNGKTLTMASKKIKRTEYELVILTDSWDTLMRFTTDNFVSIPYLGDLKKSGLRNFAELVTGAAKPSLFPFHGYLSRESEYKFYFPKDPRYVGAVNYVKCG